MMKAAAATAILLLAGVPAWAQTPDQTFEVVSIKPRESAPDRVAPPPPRPGVFYAPYATVATLIQFAYDVMSFQVIDGPDWVRRDRFEVNARAAAQVPNELMRGMVRSLLEDRFRLVVRRDQREMRRAVLVQARPGQLGPELARCEDPAAVAAVRPRRIPPGALMFTGRCRSMSQMAASMAPVYGGPITDGTGLDGLWSYFFVYAQGQPLPPGRQRDLADRENVPVFARALEESLGLELQSSRGSVDVVVIESVQRPTPD